MKLEALTDEIKKRLEEIETEYNEAKERYESLHNERQALKRMIAAAEDKYESVADRLMKKVEEREKSVPVPYIPYPPGVNPWGPPYKQPFEIVAYGVFMEPSTNLPIWYNVEVINNV